MRKIPLYIFLWFCFLMSFISKAQVNLYRCYPQAAPQAASFYYSNCEMQKPQQTFDGGYIFSFLSWSPNLHYANPVDGYTIKTDSNFVPQWKKPYYSKAIQLPTGGIILVNVAFNFIYATIEKVTQSGVTVWTKQYSGNIVLNDGVHYDSLVRFVGNRQEYYPFGGTYATNAYTMLMDTSGNFISQSLYNGSYSFSKIKRTAQGEFFVCSVSGASIAKFDSSFNFVWAKGGNFAYPYTTNLIRDIDVLPNGRIFALSSPTPYNYAGNGAILKLDTQGNIVTQSYAPNDMNELCKKSNSNYVISRQYSGHTFEIDTSMNIVWSKNWFGGGGNLMAGVPLIKNNALYTPVHNHKYPFILSSDLSGNNCASQSVPLTLTTSSLSWNSFTLTPVASTAVITAASAFTILSQSYTDSCFCMPTVTVLPETNLCVGTTATLIASGLGNLSWYTTPSGASFIAAGSQYTVSSNTATVLTLYAQDSVCAFPYRTPVNITFNAVPVLTLNAPANYSLCNGQTATISVQGASSYTWSNALNTSSIVITPTSSVTYSVIGSVAPNCTDTASVNINVLPSPTINILSSISTSPVICGGAVMTVTATGATNYTWSNGQTVNPLTYTVPILPVNVSAQQSTLGVIGADNLCWNTAQTNFSIVNTSTMQALASSSAICFGNSVTLSATGADSYTWSTQAISNSVVVSPTATSVYTVNGTYSYLSYNNCISTKTLAVNVFQKPTVNAWTSASTICPGEIIYFYANGASSYTRTNNNYVFATNIPTNYTYYSPISAWTTTTYTVIGSVAPNCSDTVVFTLNVIPSFTISTSIGSSSLVCSGTDVTVTATGASSYSWSNGQTANTFTLTTPQIPVNTTTTQTYSVTAFAGGCSATAQTSFSVANISTIQALASSSAICVGDSVMLSVVSIGSYTWSNGAQTSSFVVSPSVTAQYSVFGTNEYGCAANSSIITVSVAPFPTLSINSSIANVCLGESSTLTASGANSYTWNNGEQTPSIVVSPTNNTQYSVSGTSQFGCSASNTITLDVLSLPNLSVSGSFSLCSGNSTVLNAGGANSYTWSNGVQMPSVAVSPTGTTQYYVSGTGTNGCVSNSSVITINVMLAPMLNVNGIFTLCNPQTQTLTVSGAYSYLWKWDNTSNFATTTFLVVNPAVTTQYTITGTSAAGCTSSKVVTVTIGCVGIDAETEDFSSLRIYPTPSNGKFVIETSTENYIAIIDVSGKPIFENQFQSGKHEIDLSEFANGIYFVKTKSGGNQKIVISR